MSELRVIHLLEGLCDGMAKYELVAAKNESEPERWARSGTLSFEDCCSALHVFPSATLPPLPPPCLAPTIPYRAALHVSEACKLHRN